MRPHGSEGWERSSRDAQLVAWSHIGLAALLCCSNAVGRLHVKEAACQKRCMRTALRRACDNTWRSEQRGGRRAAERGSGAGMLIACPCRAVLRLSGEHWSDCGARCLQAITCKMWELGTWFSDARRIVVASCTIFQILCVVSGMCASKAIV